MPLVISRKAKQVFLIRNEEWLGEILGHSDFDGEDWTIGDEIVFEDGMTAEIVKLPGEKFHDWSEPMPGNLSVLLARIESLSAPKGLLIASVEDWKQLFDKARSFACLRYV
jgi:hypothetical protein